MHVLDARKQVQRKKKTPLDGPAMDVDRYKSRGYMNRYLLTTNTLCNVYLM